MFNRLKNNLLTITASNPSPKGRGASDAAYVKLILLLLFPFFSFGQNLVPNNSWEAQSAAYSHTLITGTNYRVNTVCGLTVDNVWALDDWYVTLDSPDRIVEGTAPCYDNDLAQDQEAYLILGNAESIKVLLSDTLNTNCLYQFSVWLNLETFRGTLSAPSQVTFSFQDPTGNVITSPMIYWNIWQNYSTPFIASAGSTSLEIKNIINSAGLDIDNISVTFLGCPLPVLYLYIKGGKNILRWATASEQNASHYEIYSSEGIKALSVEACGNCSHESYYSVELHEGWYVIKSIDTDGNYQYTKPVLVKGSKYNQEDDYFYLYNYSPFILGQDGGDDTR